MKTTLLFCLFALLLVGCTEEPQPDGLPPAQCCQLKEKGLLLGVILPFMRSSQHIFDNLATFIHTNTFKESHRLRPEDFTRTRVFDFVALIVVQLNRIILSLSVELENFLDYLKSPKSYSKQAFSQARKKLKFTAFIAINEQFTKSYYQEKPLVQLWNEAYLLVACDGSLVQLPESNELADHFGRWKNHTALGMVMGRASILYDVLNRITLAAEFAPCTKGERELFSKHCKAVEELFLTHKPLFLMDRGYPSFELCKDLDKAEQAFVIRCKAGFCKEVVAFAKQNIDEAWIEIPPKSWVVQGVSKRSKHKVPLKIRVVRILLPSQEYEYLLTNTTFSLGVLSELYQLRWGVETYYGFLKGNLQLENFSAKTIQGVLQDFHACILTGNLTQLVIKEADLELLEEGKEEEVGEDKKRKYNYQVNQNVALGILRNRIPDLIFHPEKLAENLVRLKTKIKKHKVAIIPNRAFERRKQRRNKRKFFFTKKRPF